MSRAQHFLNAYNELDDHLRHLTGIHDENVGFSTVLARAASKHPAVRPFERKIRRFHRLRNAIVHEQGPGYEVVAEPHERIVAELKECVRTIMHPPRLDTLGSVPLPPFSPQDELAGALAQMRDNDFSQVLVQAAEVALLTTEGIARWLEHRVPEQIIELEGVRIREVLPHEPEGTFQVMKRGQSVFDARATFRKAATRPGRLFAILVTESGRATETPVRILTPWDLLEEEE
jgi:hypothetical protein